MGRAKMLKEKRRIIFFCCDRLSAGGQNGPGRVGFLRSMPFIHLHHYWEPGEAADSRDGTRLGKRCREESRHGTQECVRHGARARNGAWARSVAWAWARDGA